jgi:hypothetical protein
MGDSRGLTPHLRASQLHEQEGARNAPIGPLLANAEKMAEYVLGIERQHTAMKEHAQWVAEYEAPPSR